MQSEKLEKTLRSLKRFIPRSLFRSLQPIYHFILALTGAVIYKFPSKEIKVVAITGTKGKSTTAEIVDSILEEAGFKTALISTIRIKIADESTPNKFKMSTPGRFFLNRTLRGAVDAGCEYAVIEMTSEAAKQYRHKFIEMDALIFTNLSPEHIESHGSFALYKKAKLSIARAVAQSEKRPRILIANTDNEHGADFLTLPAEIKIGFGLQDATPYHVKGSLTTFSFGGVKMVTKLLGEFNLYNIVAAAQFAKTQGISIENIKKGIEKIKEVPGRGERISLGQNYTVIVDYAHTPDSLLALYKTFEDKKNICVLGNTGGGRDTWKRPEMAKVAEKYCHKIILTDEDPYDEKPRDIAEEMMRAIENKRKAEIIMDRREAIRKALSYAKKNSVVLISGKGTDPYIMRANGEKEVWSDKQVTEEEIRKTLEKKKSPTDEDRR